MEDVSQILSHTNEIVQEKITHEHIFTSPPLLAFFSYFKNRIETSVKRFNDVTTSNGQNYSEIIGYTNVNGEDGLTYGHWMMGMSIIWWKILPL